METIITIKKNKPAFKALILLAQELQKNDNASISVCQKTPKSQNIDIIPPKRESDVPISLFSKLSDFPTLTTLRKKAWPKIL
jgi:hypothetical protein